MVLSIEATAARMVEALTAAKQKVPVYLQATAAPAKVDALETATFAMHCYWEGEAKLGSISGVYATRSAWRDGLEVVDVRFDPKQVSYRELLETAHSFECASKVFAHTSDQYDVAKSLVKDNAVIANEEQSARIAKDSDQKYYLQNSVLRHLPMAEFQSTKINSDVANRKNFGRWLSPRQKELIRRIVAAYKKDEEALKELIAPGEPTELGTFQQSLVTALDALEK